MYDDHKTYRIYHQNGPVDHVDRNYHPSGGSLAAVISVICIAIAFLMAGCIVVGLILISLPGAL